MENNNYVSVGNIIEQERLKRQAQISKGVSSDVYDHIEKAHQDDLSKGVEMNDNLSRFADDVDNLNKAETEFLLSKLQRQIVVDPDSNLLKSFKSIAINHLNDLEKAHKDGEHHPTKPWVWVASANGGKGDWRVEGGRAHKKAGASNTDATSGGETKKVDIAKIPNEEFKRITKMLSKKNPDHRNAERYLEEEAMSDKELANFYAVAEHYKNSSSINKLTHEYCRKWAELARQEMRSRKKE